MAYKNMIKLFLRKFRPIHPILIVRPIKRCNTIVTLSFLVLNN